MSTSNKTTLRPFDSHNPWARHPAGRRMPGGEGANGLINETAQRIAREMGVERWAEVGVIRIPDPKEVAWKLAERGEIVLPAVLIGAGTKGGAIWYDLVEEAVEPPTPEISDDFECEFIADDALPSVPSKEVVQAAERAFGFLTRALVGCAVPVDAVGRKYRFATIAEFMFMDTADGFYRFKHRATRNYLYVRACGGALAVPFDRDHPFFGGFFGEVA